MPLLIGLIAALLLAAFLYYSIRVEPHHIEITRHEIALPCLPPELDGITLCQVSDMHISRPARNTKAIFEALREVKADLYLFTGDQVRFRGGMEEFLGLLPELKTLVEPAFLVLGNSEHHRFVPTRQFVQQFREGGITPLVNESARHPIRGIEIQIVGVDDPHYRLDDFQTAYAAADPALFTILLCHSPDGLRNLDGFRADIALCGHTHAGQLRLPLIGALFSNTRHVKLIQGWYTGPELENRAGLPIGKTRVYVSRGLGTGRFSGRFLCRPELPLITLRRMTDDG